MAQRPLTDYDHGLRNGKTEATLESIAAAVDDIRERLSRLRCSDHAELLAAVQSSVRHQWALILLVLGGLGGLAAAVIRAL